MFRTAGRRAAIGAVALVVGAALTATATSAQAITDGQDAAPGQAGFAAALSMPRIERSDGTVYSSACSGALVAPRWVITAGHCVHDGDRNEISGKPRYEIDVTVGRDRDRTPARAVRAVQRKDADVVLLELDREITSTDPLPVSDSAPQVGDELTLAGWGSTDGVENPQHRPDRLQVADYEVTGVSETGMTAKATGPQKDTSACPYDSGAPFVSGSGSSAKLVATEVNGPVCPHHGEETTARSDRLAGWIAQQTGVGTHY
ncbi:S1 family peptidase [Pseudonocardia phyllosphaerae]|uniref:S1 family peptidase n=1 Tax=Pseudonocardia phyllosphaerae TaxID=3390502 RepID=UPI00397AA7C7